MAELSEKDAEEIYLIKSALEGLAAGLAVPRADITIIEQLTEINEQMKAQLSSKKKDTRMLLDLNGRFHSLLNSICGNEKLYQLIDILRGNPTERVQRLRHDALTTWSIGTDISDRQWRAVFRQLIALGFLETDREGRRFAVIPAEPVDPDVLVVPAEIPEHLDGPVRAAIVDENQFVPGIHPAEGAAELLVELFERFLLIIEGDHDADIGPLLLRVALLVLGEPPLLLASLLLYAWLLGLGSRFWLLLRLFG